MDARRELYLDANATVPLLPAVREAMHAALDEGLVNPSSLHAPGERARRRQEEARAAVAALLRADPDEIVFTSGGSEANHLALLGARDAARAPAHVAVGAIEHPSLLAAAGRLAERGVVVTHVAPDRDGVVPLPAWLAALTPATRLVACMAANNETGVVQPFEALAEALAARAIALHVDAVQWIGRAPWRGVPAGISTLALSAHKLGGPMGVGALWVRRGTPLVPWLGGGRQERGRRGGTAALLLQIGFGRAAELARARLEAGGEGSAARDAFEAALAPLPGIEVVGQAAPRLPNTTLVLVAGADGRRVAAGLSAAGVHVATGSACASGAPEPSHVLRAMGLDAARARSAVRFSFLAGHGAAEGAAAAARLAGLLPQARLHRGA